MTGFELILKTIAEILFTFSVVMFYGGFIFMLVKLLILKIKGYANKF